MTVTWMLYGLLVSALVAVAAAGVEAACRLTRVPIRWVWAGALLLTVALVALAPGRRPPPSVELPKVAMVEATAAGTFELPAPGWRDRLPALATVAVRELRAALGGAGRRAPEGLGGYLLVAWGAGALLCLLAVGATHYRFRRQRRRWPTAELLGTRVRVAPEVGPVVMGVARPEIVVPRWFLDLSPAESRLVLTHESEHIRARDPLLLTVGWGIAALLAWSPAAWWMLARLRLAVELDCDSRVLARGADPRSYGSVLIDLAGRSSRLQLGMVALADPPTQLERRLLAMTTPHVRFAAGRALVLGALAGTAVFAACMAELPTAADIRALDVEKAEQAATALAGGSEAGTIYTLDGVVVTRAEALAVTPSAIAEVRVARNARPAEGARIEITTANGGGAIARSPAAAAAEPGFMPGPMEGVVRLRGVVRSGPEPLYIVDGVQIDPSTTPNPLRGVDPSNVESIRIMKEPSAIARYGERAANGVVIVSTKASQPFADAPAAGREPLGRGYVTSSREGMTAAQVSDALGRASASTALFLVDGVRTDRAAVLALAPGEIVMIAVADTPPAMVERYGPETASGMVLVTTRSSAR